MNTVSAHTVACLADASHRTILRKIERGELHKATNDGKGRAMLHEHEIRVLCDPTIPDADWELVLKADRGEPAAQNDLALFYLERQRHTQALYWLELAAAQNHPDALHWLGRMHIDGMGVERSQAIGLMHLAKSATLGHSISTVQINGWR